MELLARNEDRLAAYFASHESRLLRRSASTRAKSIWLESLLLNSFSLSHSCFFLCYRTELLARDQDRLAAYFASHEQRLARRQGSAERRWDATWQRLVKAEQRRAALLEAERGKAAERYLQVRFLLCSLVNASVLRVFHCIL